MVDSAENERLAARAIEFAEGIAASSGMDINVSVVKEEPEGITLAFNGPDARYLVGKGGQGLDALQYLALLSLHKRSATRFHVTFDADNYRARREQTLINLAAELARQVTESGQEAVLDPLSPLERRIVHQALSENPSIRTYSEGEEPERYIVIAPAN
jgi:spoIIIJ-associated protein